MTTKKTRKSDTPRMTKKREDVLTTVSARKGFAGIFERLIRTFRMASFLILLTPLVAVCAFCLAVSMIPGVFVFLQVEEIVKNWSLYGKTVAYAGSLALALALFWLTMIFVVPAVNFIMPFRVKPFKGSWYSLPVIPWYIHNALVQMARYTVLDFVTPTPLNVLFYRMMGMKIGKGVVINTSNISDPCLITLEDYVTIGGSVTMFAHYGMKGYLIIEPVIIRRGATIGLKASVMGDVIIEKNVTVTPHTVVMPKSRIPEDTIYFG